jgi:glyoxylase-like metal-dependent hydrolase (beta-lactamase superfamily II)
MSVDRLPVAPGPWFVAEAFAGAATRITEPHVDPFIRCNIWHVRGRDADLLVDTGLGVASLLDGFPELFAGRRVIVVATHYHYDHTGGLAEFDERWIHRAEGATVADGAAIGGDLSTATWSDEGLAAVRSAGYVLPDDGELLTASPSAGFDPDAYSVTGCEPTRLLDEGDTVDLGDRTFTVLHLPGHSPGSIGLWEEERGLLFSGDAVYDGPLLDGGDDSDIEDYLVTMDRLRRLPVDIVHGGHEESFGRSRLIELCEAYIDRRSGMAAPDRAVPLTG